MAQDTLPALAAAGAAMGLSAGFAPGPLLSLVLSQTLAHGPGEGVKVALAPLVTDTPIILAAWLVLSRLSGSPAVLGVLSLAGACLLGRYGWDCLSAPPPDAGDPARAPRSLLRGVAANFANPHPYLFWTTVGVPMLLDAANSGPWAVAVFLAVFYAAIVGAKILAALVAGRFRRFLGSRSYRLLMAGLGLSLFYYAVAFARHGFSLLGGT
ncbi:Lysine exporter protein (LYSE/YGGA) [Solidesulfovibrio carbinoliphilus subsp. oakridgensis]|uniref:Lysine exporter protein (LYSE/YGGA) n=1 Tax=Solidesulfovibrio carbinoliphilus subsp. oakridgensis TaxID=694327 RepID=G7Q6X0_9BACT|nr:LysE family transporter [Solidesulfovibrio carbinoliphilus]EHJ48453.1 Lysine exporter protein (LYSE/YGGA) [Solidesulfovibrio carbinoliphilus subsp. oakridgensis]